MAKFNTAKIEECEAWVATHGLIDYGGAKLKEFVREMGIDEKTYRLWMKGKPQFRLWPRSFSVRLQQLSQLVGW